MLIENRTYLLNKDNNFTPASVDNVKIHEFIAEIREKVKNHPMEGFDTIADITENLRKQFAGLFQNLLVQDAAVTEQKTAYDLQASADKINDSVNHFDEEINYFFKKIDSTIFRTNFAVRHILKLLGYTKYQVFIPDKIALSEYLSSIGFVEDDTTNLFENYSLFIKHKSEITITLKIMDNLFDMDGKIINIQSKEQLDEMIIYNETRDDENDIIENSLPF